jgi:hypothetical protein
MPGLMRCLASIEQSLRHSCRGCGDEQAVLLTRHASLVDRELAYSLKALFDAAKSRDPKAAAAAAAR